MADRMGFRPYRAIVAGFCASAAAALTYMFAHLTSSIVAEGLGEGSWFHALISNSLVDLAASQLYVSILIHFVIGITLAGLYAAVVDRMPSGNSWGSGLQFALIPWFVSALVFFPLVGAGPFALSLGAGFLPILGWLCLHLVYGGFLGYLYSPESSRTVLPQESLVHAPYETRLTREKAKGGALGILGGAVLGSVLLGIVRLVVGADTEAMAAPGLPLDYTVVAGIFFFATMGMLVGMWSGATVDHEKLDRENDLAGQAA